MESNDENRKSPESEAHPTDNNEQDGDTYTPFSDGPQTLEEIMQSIPGLVFKDDLEAGIRKKAAETDPVSAETVTETDTAALETDPVSAESTVETDIPIPENPEPVTANATFPSEFIVKNPDKNTVAALAAFEDRQLSKYGVPLPETIREIVNFLPAAAEKTIFGKNLSAPATSSAASSAVQVLPSILPPKNKDKKQKMECVSIGRYVLSPDEYLADAGRLSCYRFRKTGYANLDRIQPFYPGLYVLGAASSIGKTTFVYQMADQLAANGETVLFFSMEQTPVDFASKGIAREIFKYCEQTPCDTSNGTVRQNRPYSSMALHTMDIAPEDRAYVNACIDSYGRSVYDRLFVYSSPFAMTVEDIAEEVRKKVNEGTRPVVIIDYLQIIAPSKNAKVKDIRSGIDHVVQTLKLLQIECDITVIVVSSINRMNYMTTIDYESFKESGGIEYTADVLWGLQLSVIDHPDFMKISAAAVTKKRGIVQRAKAQDPRSVKLVCTKNRFGSSSYSVLFTYYPSSDYFKPADPESQEQTRRMQELINCEGEDDEDN